MALQSCSCLMSGLLSGSKGVLGERREFETRAFDTWIHRKLCAV